VIVIPDICHVLGTSDEGSIEANTPEIVYWIIVSSEIVFQDICIHESSGHTIDGHRMTLKLIFVFVLVA
jgi:hypothetical protein